MCDRVRGHEPTDDLEEHQNLPSPFGGAGGLFGERPPLTASDAELDSYCEELYARSLDHFRALVAAYRRPRRKRGMRDYTTKNCEEARGSG